ncbi:tetratricopeptide repeat protein [uncultured Bacteroides sp.]|uniref:tetratricopeptide repeat protein n=1 Tax=uncultured Bacteroides sp. TaxID=162156 RepID=UPI002AAB9CC6|nr:tetratricopeptide repeat protein [uncultured Bacteroides sp.]
MKYPVLYSFILFLLSGLLLSCHSNSSSSNVLKQVEALLEKHPDSAFTLLNKVKAGTLKNSENARYCLLMTKAMFKNSVPIVSDSLINIAVEYYKDNGDSINKAEAYLYAGRVNQDMKNVKDAMAFFLKASDFVENGKDYKLQYLIYYYIGDLYFNENLYDSALKAQQKALDLSLLLNDSSYMSYSFRSIAVSYLCKSRSDTAIIYYYKALNVLPKSDTRTPISLYNEMGGVYKNIGDYTNAIKFVNRAISLKPTSVELFYTNIVKADVYLRMGRNDSAIDYYNRTIHSPDLYTRAASYDGLAHAYSTKGDYKKAFECMCLFNSYRDSIELETRSAAIIEMQNLYQHGKSKDQIQRLTSEKQEQTIRYYRVSFFSFVALLLSGGAFFVYRGRNKKELLEKSKLLLEQENRLIKMRQKDGHLREDFFKRLNNIKKIPSLDLVNKKEKKVLIDATAKISLTDNDWEELIRNINIAYDHFTDRLIKTYPNLTIQEIHLCCLVKIKVARNDLANIFCITPQSVKTTKYRIKKDKMGVTDKNMTLDLFIEKF